MDNGTVMETKKINEREFIQKYVKKDERSYRLIRGFFYPVVWILFHPKAYHVDNIPEDGPVIIAVNHRQAPDPVFIAFAYKKRAVRYLAAKKFHDGFFGFLFRMAQTIPVDRSRHTPEVMEAADEVLQRNGVIGIFPEGTRNRTQDILLPFKFGAVALAQKNDAYIVPCVNVGKYTPFLSRVETYFGKPYKIDKDADLKEENEKLRNIIYDMYVEYGKEDERLEKIRAERSSEEAM